MSKRNNKKFIYSLLLRRESKGLQIAVLARILFLFGAFLISMTVSQNNTEKILTFSIEISALIIFIIIFLLIKKIKRLIYLGTILSISDIIFVSLVPIAFYFSTVKMNNISTAYLLKTVFFLIIISFIIINSLGTRPIYLIITTSGFSIIYIFIFIIALLDKRTVISQDYIKAYMGPALNPGRFYIELFVLNVTGVFLAFLTYSFRKSIKETVKYEEKLIHQEKKALIGTLTTGMAHEIKNQLMSISLLETIKKNIPKEEQQNLSSIYDSRDRILSIIDEIRALVKDEEINYNLFPYNLNKIINESIMICKLDPKSRNIKIKEETYTNIEILVDRNKFIQVLINIIRNAIQSISNYKSGYILISSRKINNFVEIKINDNGIGIDKKNLINIWTPFYSTKGEEGIGLGLDISKRIIEGHNGKITCKSIKGRGTTFYIKVPIS